MTAAVALVEGLCYPEGPVWWGNTWHWVEYGAHRLARLDAGGALTVWEENGFGPASALVSSRGTLWITGYDAHALVELSPVGRPIRRLTHDDQGAPLIGPNDLIEDAGGGLFFSACGPFEPGRPAEDRLYFLAATAIAPTLVADGLAYPNGLAFLKGTRTLVVAEHLANRLACIEVDRDGRAGPRRTWCELSELAPDPPLAPATLGPDGLAVDARGRVYVAQFGAGRILVLEPDPEGGKPGLCAVLPAPLSFVTNVALGPAGAGDLVVTAFAADAPPYAGALYQLDVPVMPSP